ncbi:MULTISPECIES: hypothetical protein [Aeromonas]|uniref:hypothetical protein n=1 Tax=Aeromonas TaxID=642 RepID=UPI001CEFC274|nr:MULTISPECIES: hypothetical protein [Aeromonas]UCM46564.1 hypothetical protein LEO73_07315 [Aeromonas dhakensis]
MSKVYRFHGPADLPTQGDPVLLRKRKKRIRNPIRLIAADLFSITDENGTRPLNTYKSDFGCLAVTLTKRESDLVALSNPGVKAPVALEELYPWLPEQLYLNDSLSSFKVIQHTIRKFGDHFISSGSFCDEKWNTICNALRRRSVLDARFYTAWHLPIQDVYLLEEYRPDRSVVSIDFNSMYPACMQHLFPKPSDLRLVHLDINLDEIDTLSTGLYRCIINGPSTDFIYRHNPFRSFHSGHHLLTGLDEPIEIDLNEFELEFYRRHFQSIHLVDAVISDKVVTHPLAKEVRRSFAKRLSYRNQGNKALADREKFLSTLMTSCANRPTRPVHSFKTRNQAMSELKTKYGISPPDDEPEVATDIWLQGRKGIKFDVKDSFTMVQGPNLNDGSACHLLGQRIVARGRIVLLEMMERILDSAPDVEICYTNIDSIHFSLPTKYLELVTTWLQSECSDAMGSFKIEAITRHGLWLEPGRYWLYSDVVEKFRNRSVGDREHPFKDHAIHVVSRQLGKMYVPIRVTLRMEQTMSPLRSLTLDPEQEIFRQRLIEVGDATIVEDVLNELEKNQHYATPIRMLAFSALRERINSSRCAATKREG